MKKAIATTLLTAAILSPSLGIAQEIEVEAEVGWVSEYYYRGLPQKTSSASAGIEAALSGFYLGTWAADVGDGAEVDLYGGYGVELGDLTLGIGGTGYFYTGDFDETYLEGTVTAGYGPIDAEFSIGTWDADPSQDYTFTAVTASHRGGYATVGLFGGDFEGTYAEVGYGFAVSEFDLTLSWIWSEADLLGAGSDDHTLVLGLSRTFSLFGSD